MADSIAHATADSALFPTAANPASFASCDVKIYGVRTASIVLVSGAHSEDVLRAKLSRFALPGLAPRRAANSGSLSVLWQGPGQWLCVCVPDHDTDGQLLGVLRESLDGSGACVTDLSHARKITRVEGGGAVELLCRLCPLDIESMREDDCWMTRLSHFNISLHKVASQQFDVYVMRSFGRSLWQTLEHEAKAFAAQTLN